MSGPKARKAQLFRRAVLNHRRSEPVVRRAPDGAFDAGPGHQTTGARDQQQQLKAVFGDTDAA